MLKRLCIFALLITLYRATSAAELADGDFPGLTLEGTYTVGGSFVGASEGQYVKLGRPLRGEATHILADKPCDCMATLPGEAWSIERMNFDGRKLAKAAILISRPAGSKGIGTGKHSIRNVTVNACQYGIQFGEQLDQSNGDNCTVEKFTATNCEAVMVTFNNQSLCNTFRSTRVMFAKNVFQFYAGGKFKAEDTGVKELREPCNLLHLVGTGEINKKGVRVERGIGNNADHYTLYNTWADTLSGSWLCLVRMEHHIPWHPNIVIDGGKLSYDDYTKDGRYQLVLKNPVTVRISNFSNLQSGSFYVEHNPEYPVARIIVDNGELAGGDINGDGRFDAKDLIAPECAKHVWLTARDCTDTAGKPLLNVYHREGVK